MKNHEQRAADVNSQIKIFMSAACAGDFDAIRLQVAEGFDLNGTNQFGDTLLEYAISALEFYLEAPSTRWSGKCCALALIQTLSARMDQARSLRPSSIWTPRCCAS
ncbi:MAG: ankyrin repeat domain-containing protein [Candidatus Accumulibacter necessarius]